ncbi:LLM class flavin-dependent oxidoreductase [Amycolatopsis sp. K13G38]|uniref:LLM class flavin-dependent oxidoreductase n=1 Tax=Amycolatopsis acididurans TaxID=2724524 RepID=A0ABX1JCN6_9PSEU|nr:LLM class flavin-dependent oxidoreductase [Amycolatopsis acididurans]NKQ57229.1 LLM class flavin-dependent oxidoreductase [Amycolatopsis acididurans]
MHVGIGLWTMQATAAAPAAWPALYARMLDEARLLDSLGVDSMWFAEHHLWYDGYCPAPLVAAAGAAGVTDSLRVGTAMTLAPLHDADRLAAQAAELELQSGGRLELGLGLGHRDAEFDAFGVRRDRRGKRMDETLDVLCGPGRFDPARIWAGGMAPAALHRIGRRGLSVLLPQTLGPARIRKAQEIIDAAAGTVPRGRTGALRDVYLAKDGAAAREWFGPRYRRHYEEEAGAWWVMTGPDGPTNGFRARERLDEQLDRATGTALVGDPDEVLSALLELPGAGVDTVVVRMQFDFMPPDELARTARLFTEEVLPVLREVS